MMKNQRFEIVDLRHGDFGHHQAEDAACVGKYRTGLRAERSCHSVMKRGDT